MTIFLNKETIKQYPISIAKAFPLLTQICMSLPNLAKITATIDTGNDEYYQTRDADNHEYSHAYTTAVLKRLRVLGNHQAMSDDEWEAFQTYGMPMFNAFFQPFWRKQSVVNCPERDIQALSQSMLVRFKQDKQAQSILNWNVLNATARQLEDVDVERLYLAEETLYQLYQYLEPYMPQLEKRYMFISTIGGGLMLHFYCQSKEEQKFSATVFLMCDQHVFNKSSSITFDWHKVTKNSNNTVLRNELYKLITQAQKPEIQELLFPHLCENNEEKHNLTYEQFALTQQLHIDVHQVEALFQKYVQQGLPTHQCIPRAIEQQFIENNKKNIVSMDNSRNNDVKDLYSLFKDIFYHFHDDSGRLAFKPNQFKLIEYPRHRFTDKPHVAHFGLFAYISAEQTWGVAEKMIFDCADKWAINGNDVQIVRQAFNELKALYPNDTAIHRVENHDFSQDECLSVDLFVNLNFNDNNAEPVAYIELDDVQRKYSFTTNDMLTYAVRLCGSMFIQKDKPTENWIKGSDYIKMATILHFFKEHWNKTTNIEEQLGEWDFDIYIPDYWFNPNKCYRFDINDMSNTLDMTNINQKLNGCLICVMNDDGTAYG